MEAYRENGGTPVPIPDLETVQGEWSASCSGHCAPMGRRSCYPLNKRLGGSQSQSGCFGGEKNLWPCQK